MTVRTYAPGEILVTVGASVITGFADNAIVKIETSADLFTKKVGADGNVVRTASADKSGTVTITLQSASISNTVLQAYAIADANGLAGTVPLLISDNNGTTKHSAAHAWVKKQPDDEFTNEAGNREWVLDVDNIVSFLGESNLS